MNKIELLAPAKDVTLGKIAINHGADALYIGATYSARMNASNDIHDIEALCKYAHLFNAKVYVALNTLLTSSELKKTEQLIHQLYEAGADALIIQDLSILTLPLPPIPLHASTQCDIRSIERVAFFESLQFERVILARELSLAQIAAIRQATTIELEAFVHGAVCVGYSGKCFISEHSCGRSANKGSCAQLCRLPYSLQDENGKVLHDQKHLLSLKDMNRSSHLEAMLHSGVTSFKIEGRLKDEGYVKNVTAYYRQKIDQLLEGNSFYSKNSEGAMQYYFTPAPEKSFHRSNTTFHLTKTSHSTLHLNTSKSIGEELGCVTAVGNNYFTIDTDKKVANGDGVVFFNKEDVLEGFRINNVEGEKLFWLDRPASLYKGATIYRNYDHLFEKAIQHKSAERKLPIHMLLAESETGFSLTFTDERNNIGVAQIEHPKELAKNDSDTVLSRISQQLSKLGNTLFQATQIDINFTAAYHLPASVLNQLRRDTVARLEENILHNYPKPCAPAGTVTSEQVAQYKEEYAINPKQLLQSKYCIRGAYQLCLKYTTPTPLYLVSGTLKWRIECDCLNCEMSLSTP